MKINDTEKFKQSNLEPVAEIAPNIVPVLPGISTIESGVFQSKNFRAGRSGWRLSEDGTIEALNGIFSGTFKLGGALITVSDIDKVQDAIDEVSALGGGTVALVPNTYTASTSITIPSYVVLDGNGATIDFNNGAYQVSIQGSDAYSTGTVSVSNDGTAVTGSGTTWTNAMVGRYILLEDFWYEITAVGGTTSLTIGRAYMGTTLSGSTYVLANTVNGTGVKNLILQNSSTSLLKIRYANVVTMDSVTVINGLIGVDGDDSSFFNILNSAADLCGTGMTFDNFYFGTFFNNNITQCSTAGSVFNSIRNWCIDVFAFVNMGGTAMSFTNCSNNDILDFSIQHITGKGIEFVSGNYDMGITAGVIKDCTSDGIKLTATSDAISISNIQIHDNGGYGVNIAASTCDKNIVIGNYFSTNSSGAVSNSGTSTIIAANQGATDSPGATGTYGFGQTSRTAVTGTGTQTIAHGLGKTPTLVKIVAVTDGGSSGAGVTTCVSHGTGTASNNTSTYHTKSRVSDTAFSGQTSNIIEGVGNDGSTALAQAVISALDATNITLNFTTLTGTGVVVYIQWEAFG